ncbi:hypothetical protein D6D12_05502 [Aureobasidium pullulans]|uniref:Peptidase S33 tripeptidyl aminopeptidase-like C-terminal domain-containing protein n=1 Tax=Aureobasidium pullulans TaxID=5580 RepID=A0AB74JS44_AURPU|nr:hypothetical protein D6D12_05502 [Aureobasidium pullulans]
MSCYSPMEQKTGKLDQPSVSREGVTTSRPIWRSTALCVAACLSFLTFLHGWDLLPTYQDPNVAFIPKSDNHSERNFSWHDIEASPELYYHQCYEDYQCAKLQVPMDWWRNSSRPGKNISIAVIRLPAKVSVTDPRYGGAVLTNPGGPGGSGVAQMLRNGRATQIIVDAEMDPNTTSANSEARYHDIISFDPRGIAHTTPGIHCFPDSLARSTWALQNEALGLLGSSEDSFYRNWYRSRALAEGCSAATGTTEDGSEAIGEHVNTSPVARDMLEIVERHADWVSKQVSAETSPEVVERLRYVRGEPKIKYWGNSYGTIIGQTFASMFPDRINRIVLDGVCNAHDYFFGSWFSNLSDADLILERFFSYCYSAGPEDCSFYSASGAAAIKQNYKDLLSHIFEHPMVVPSSRTRGPDVITWSDVKSMVRLGMYQPLIYSPMVADLLTSISSGNGSLFADFKAMSNTFTCPGDECTSAGPFSDECNQDDNGADATLAILCTDGPGLGDIDEESFQEYWHALQQQSQVLGDWWAHTRLGCVGWKTKAKNRFEGPFAGNLSHPILFIGNTLDPVTPLANAKEMAQNFPGSIVLQQDSEGHTSWSSPSLCTAKATRHYFQSGLLPPLNTICKTDNKPFINTSTSLALLTLEDKELVEAMKVMEDTVLQNVGLRRKTGGF